MGELQSKGGGGEGKWRCEGVGGLRHEKVAVCVSCSMGEWRRGE